jgi:hypothetical protein
LSLRHIASLLVPVPHRHAPVEAVVRETTARLVETAMTTVGEMMVAGRMAHQASSVHNSPVLVAVVLGNKRDYHGEEGFIFLHSDYGHFTVFHALLL